MELKRREKRIKRIIDSKCDTYLFGFYIGTKKKKIGELVNVITITGKKEIGIKIGNITLFENDLIKILSIMKKYNK